MDADSEIVPRTRMQKKSNTKENTIDKDNNKNELEKMLNNIPKTNEQKNIESDQWSWETKIWIVLAVTIVIVVLLLLLYVLWSNDATNFSMHKYESPPGMRNNGPPPGRIIKYGQPGQPGQPGQQSSYVDSNIQREDLKNKMMKVRNKSAAKLDQIQPAIINAEQKLGQVPNENIDNPLVISDNVGVILEEICDDVKHDIGKIPESIFETDSKENELNVKAHLSVLNDVDPNSITENIKNAMDEASIYVDE